MELDNAFNQCDREIATRYDFKNTETKIEKTGLKVLLESGTEERVKAVKSFSGDDRDKVKAHLISLFNLVDPTDPRLVKARSQLASALF